MTESIEVVTFNTPRSRKRLAKILAAKLDKNDVSSLMNFLLEREINRNFSAETQRELLLGAVHEEKAEYQTEPKKAPARRDKAA